MICKCYIIEVEINKWLIAFSECVEAHHSFGPFNSFWEAESYHREYLSKYSLKPYKVDLEHPERSDILRAIKGPPFKLKYWDFEDYKVMAWRNAGFRSRR